MHPRFTEPTQRQLEIIATMVDYHAEHGQWPTHREIAAGASISSSNVRPYVEALLSKGLAARGFRGERRGVRITPLGVAKLVEWRNADNLQETG